MEEISRMANDINILAKRVDDVSMRLAMVEKEQTFVDERIADVKILIIEKNNDLRKDFEREMIPVKNFITRQSNLGFWLITLVAGSLIIALLNLIIAKGP